MGRSQRVSLFIPFRTQVVSPGDTILFVWHVELFGVLSMNSIRWKTALYIILVITAVVFLVNWLFSDQIFTFQFVVDCIGKSVSLITLLSGLFCTRLWKCRIFQKSGYFLFRILTLDTLCYHFISLENSYVFFFNLYERIVGFS